MYKKMYWSFEKVKITPLFFPNQMFSVKLCPTHMSCDYIAARHCNYHTL